MNFVEEVDADVLDPIRPEFAHETALIWWITGGAEPLLDWPTPVTVPIRDN